MVSTFAKNSFIRIVKAYRLLLSPWIGGACRFMPTCSQYAIDALELHGAAVGSYLAAARIARCHPWCQGGIDTVPTTTPRLFSRLKSQSQKKSS